MFHTLLLLAAVFAQPEPLDIERPQGFLQPANSFEFYVDCEQWLQCNLVEYFILKGQHLKKLEN